MAGFELLVGTAISTTPLAMILAVGVVGGASIYLTVKAYQSIMGSYADYKRREIPKTNVDAAVSTPPGGDPRKTCDRETEVRLNKRAHDICDSRPGRSCTREDANNESLLNDKVAQAYGCLQARWDVTNVCFGGVLDKEHEAAISQAKSALEKCNDKYKYIRGYVEPKGMSIGDFIKG